MVSSPLVSIITPTWHRHDLLLDRCIPSVDSQTYPKVEQIVVSDGPDPELAARFRNGVPVTHCQDIRQGRRHPVWYYELREHSQDMHWGTYARKLGLEMAAGELIGYLDDDDAFRPEHVALLAAALAEHPEAGFAVSLMESRRPHQSVSTVIGHGPPSAGNVGTPMLLHRREILDRATWGEASSFEDWELVNSWLQEDIQYVQVDEITVDVWPSAFGQF